MMKKIAWVLSLISAMMLPSTVSGQTGDFPFFRSFLDGNENGIKRLGEPVHSEYRNSAKLTDYGLQLTDGTSQVGAFYLSGYSFTPDVGIRIEFEYMMYPTLTDGITDGIAMFLVENNSKYTGANLTYGSHGAAFGYTHRWSKQGNDSKYIGYQISGIKGAYLAVALDNGPFKTIRMEPEEQRNGIAYGGVGPGSAEGGGYPTTSWKPIADDTHSNVTIRGAAGRGVLKNLGESYYNGDTPEGFWGYPVLITRYTGARNASSFHLNTATGEFDKHTGIDITTPFKVSSGGIFDGPEDANYRKVIINLAPNKDGGDGFKITVTIQHGQEESTVIKDYTYPTTLKYMENAAVRRNENEPWPDSYKCDLTVPVPDSLIMGFSGSTGTETAYTNIIKNLRVTVLFGAQTENDHYEHRRGPVTVKPLDNDFAYEDENGVPQPSQDNVDPGSFRFKVNEKEVLTGESRYECEADDGKWVFDPSTSEAMFFPNKGFTGTTEIMYDVKGKTDPYSKELYRSSLAKITVVIADNQPI